MWERVGYLKFEMTEKLNLSFLNSSFSADDDDSSLKPTAKQFKPCDDANHSKASRGFVSSSPSSSLGKHYILKKLGKSMPASMSASVPKTKQAPITVNEDIRKSLIRFKRTLSRSDDKLSHYMESKGGDSKNDIGIARSPQSSFADTKNSWRCNGKVKFFKVIFIIDLFHNAKTFVSISGRASNTIPLRHIGQTNHV